MTARQMQVISLDFTVEGDLSGSFNECGVLESGVTPSETDVMSTEREF